MLLAFIGFVLLFKVKQTLCFLTVHQILSTTDINREINPACLTNQVGVHSKWILTWKK